MGDEGLGTRLWYFRGLGIGGLGYLPWGFEIGPETLKLDLRLGNWTWGFEISPATLNLDLRL